tara:strand:- start:8000 stop:8131 length:132 start_codon:yes stop_codon:yes gene_type:complete
MGFIIGMGTDGKSAPAGDKILITVLAIVIFYFVSRAKMKKEKY